MGGALPMWGHRGNLKAMMRGILVSCLVGVLLLLAMGCASQLPQDDVLSQPPGGPAVSMIVSNSDLAVGENRLSFGLVDRDYMPVRPELVELQAVFYEAGAQSGQVRYRTTAQYEEWPPEGRRGIFVAQVTFDEAGTATAEAPGIWEVHATFEDESGQIHAAAAAITVSAQHRAPFIGDAAPPSDTPTAARVADLRTISSSVEPDPALYQLSLADAVRSGVPAVVTFSTPAFCVTATCGPQVETLSELAERYAGRANFVHVEVYKDPHLVDPAQVGKELVPAVEEWGLVSEPWTFVIGSDGRITARFEQYVPPQVLELALQAAISP